MNTTWQRKPVFEAPEQPPLSSLEGWADHHAQWDYWLAMPALRYLQAEGCTLITDKNLESQALELHGIRTPDGVVFTRWCVDLLWLAGLLSGMQPLGRQYLALLSPMLSKSTRNRLREAQLRDFLMDSMLDWRRGLQGMDMYQLLRALELARSDAPWQPCPVDPAKVLEPHLRRLGRDRVLNDILEKRKIENLSWMISKTSIQSDLGDANVSGFSAAMQLSLEAIKRTAGVPSGYYCEPRGASAGNIYFDEPSFILPEENKYKIVIEPAKGLKPPSNE